MTFIPIIGDVIRIASKSSYLRAMALPGVGVAVGAAVTIGALGVAAYAQAKKVDSLRFLGWQQREYEARMHRNQALLVAGAGAVVFASSLVILSQPHLLMAFAAASWFGAAVKAVQVGLPVFGVLLGSTLAFLGINDLAREILGRVDKDLAKELILDLPSRERLIRGGIFSSAGGTVAAVGLFVLSIL